MALLQDIIDPKSKRDTRYHRIAAIQMRYEKMPGVKGAKGAAFVDIQSYESEAARQAFAAPVRTQTVRVYFGSDVCEVLQTNAPKAPVTVRGEDGELKTVAPPQPIILPVVRSDDPTRAEIYAAINGLPEFEGAESA